ncbi:MAG: glycosyltransferase family 4 protein [Chloroflexi bacterium]|nr:glycosyltransferase family 4 protein [Chloroflexota bacterium]
MKIAIVSPYDFSYPGGVTSHISHLQSNFTQMGHQVRVLAPSSKPYEMMANPDVITVGKPTPIPASGSIARITLSLRLAKRVKEILSQEQFDIVHLHEPLVPSLPITVLRFSTAVNVGTFHAYHDKSRAYFYARRILKRWFRKLDGKIAVSSAAMEFVSRYFPGYYNVIPNGIDAERFAIPQPPLEEYCDGKLNILFVGRLEKRKGLKYLLCAFARLKKQFSGIRLVVVGPDGGLLAGLQRWVEKEKVPDVIFVGFVPFEQLPRYYQTAHIFCSPATGQESFGIVLLEAMAAAKPIVASRIGGYPDLITHGREGLLVEPKDDEALAASLGRLLEDETLRHSMGLRGQTKAACYSWKPISSRILDYYQRLLEERLSAYSPGA